jgi:hypothetical protein
VFDEAIRQENALNVIIAVRLVGKFSAPGTEPSFAAGAVFEIITRN